MQDFSQKSNQRNYSTTKQPFVSHIPINRARFCVCVFYNSCTETLLIYLQRTCHFRMVIIRMIYSLNTRYNISHLSFSGFLMQTFIYCGLYTTQWTVLILLARNNYRRNVCKDDESRAKNDGNKRVRCNISAGKTVKKDTTKTTQQNNNI